MQDQPNNPQPSTTPEQTAPATTPPTPPAPSASPTTPHPPMSPQTKKKIILFSSLGGALLILGITAIFLVPIIFKTDYASTYRVAKEIKNENYSGISEVLNACEDMTEYADNGSVSEKIYSEYITKCTAGLSENLGKKIDETRNNPQSAKRHGNQDFVRRI
jgi:hypothetical protein